MKHSTKELRSLTDLPGSFQLFAFLADRDNEKPVEIEKLLTATKRKIDRNDLVQICKRLDAANFGNFVAGRRTFPSRFVFYYTPSSIGKVALGMSDDLEKLDTPTEFSSPAPKKGIAMATSLSANFTVKATKDSVVITLPTNASRKDRKALADYVLSNQIKKAS